LINEKIANSAPQASTRGQSSEIAFFSACFFVDDAAARFFEARLRLLQGLLDVALFLLGGFPQLLNLPAAPRIG
jgi:hypothetical protein